MTGEGLRFVGSDGPTNSTPLDGDVGQGQGTAPVGPAPGVQFAVLGGGVLMPAAMQAAVAPDAGVAAPSFGSGMAPVGQGTSSGAGPQASQATAPTMGQGVGQGVGQGTGTAPGTAVGRRMLAPKPDRN